MAAESYFEMELREIQLTEDSREQAVVVLSEKYGAREFPVYVGGLEARALDDIVLSAIQATPGSARPLTHDLICRIIDTLRGTLRQVKITHLSDGVFYAALEMEDDNGKILLVDCRPSDALVVAMKKQVPIFVEEKVLDEVGLDLNDINEEDDTF